MTNYLIMPVGMPGCGKTTLRSWLVDKAFPEDGVVSADDYRRILTGDTTNQDANGTVFRIVELLVHGRLSSGQSVYLDNTNLRRRDRFTYYKMAQMTGAHIIVVRFSTAIEECRRRNDERSRKVPDVAMDKMEGIFRSSCSTSQIKTELTEFPLADLYSDSAFVAYDWDFLRHT